MNLVQEWEIPTVEMKSCLKFQIFGEFDQAIVLHGKKFKIEKRPYKVDETKTVIIGSLDEGKVSRVTCLMTEHFINIFLISSSF